MLLTLLFGMLVAQTPTAPTMPRDGGPAVKEGTAVIRGRVTDAATGAPLRRAMVSLMGGPAAPVAPGGSRPKSIATNSDGRFQFTGLLAGTYHLRVAPGPYRGQHLAVGFGSRLPRDPSQPIELQDGQTFQADVALPRGGAISGRVIDEFGEPITNVSVYPARILANGTVQRAGGGQHGTDDLGRFRLYGLEPGEYAIVAEGRGIGGHDMDGPPEGFMPTYYPSTFNEHEAGRIRVTGPGEFGDVEIQMIRTRTFHITGTVVDSQGRTIMRPMVSLMKQSGGGSTSSGMSIDEAGMFRMRGVVPGDYRLIARTRQGPSSEEPATAPPAEYANVPLTVNADVENLVVTTRAGVTVTGRIVFAEGAPTNLPTGIRVMAFPDDRMMMMGGPPSAQAGSDLQFTLKDLFGPQRVQVSGLPPRHVLKAVMLGGADITETAVEFKPEHQGQLQIVITARSSTLEGTVTDDSGAPASNARVVALPEGHVSPKMRSSRVRGAMTTKTGHFTLAAMLAGRYHVFAAPRDHLAFVNEAQTFEPFIRDSVLVVLGEDEKRTVELRLHKAAQEP